MPDGAGGKRVNAAERVAQCAQSRAHAERLTDLLAASPADPSCVLTPIAALREVTAVCESIEFGRSPPNAADRRSLQADVQLALTSLGAELRGQLQPTWADFFHGDLNELSPLLDSGGGVSRLRASAGSLLDRVRRPEAAQAVWRDILYSHNGSVSPDEAMHWVAVLREIDESLGHEWQWRTNSLQRAAISDAGNECDEILSQPPVSTAAVAWFVFADADLADGFLRVGQIQFFSSRLWPDAATSRQFLEGVPDSELPEELDDEALEHWFKVRDNSEALVYARVELDGPRAEPARTPEAHRRPAGAWARELVTAVVEAGSFRIGGTRWRLLEGESVFHRRGETGKSWSGTGEFQDPRIREEIRRFRNPLTERTGDALEELDPQTPNLIAEGDRAAITAVEEARWYEAARAQGDHAQRLVLHVRAFERALPVTRDFHWNEAVAHYLREFWAVEEFGDAIFRLAHSTYRQLNLSRRDDLDKFEQWYVSESRDGFNIFPGTFLHVAGAAYQLLPRQRRLERQELKRVARWADDPAATRKRLAELIDRFSRLLNRSVRQRNAAVHGVTTVPEVVASVDPFIARLAALVVSQTIHSASVGENLIDALERARVRSRRMLWRLDNEDGTVAEILFKPEEQE